MKNFKFGVHGLKFKVISSVALTAFFWILGAGIILADCIPTGGSKISVFNPAFEPCLILSQCCSPDALCQATKISQSESGIQWKVECLPPSSKNVGSQGTTEKISVPQLQVGIPGFEGFTAEEEKLIKGEGEETTYAIPWIGEYFVAIYKWAVQIIAVLAVIMIMVAGAQWMLAAGNASQIGDAKSRISHALIGLILILGTNVILGFVNPELTIFKPILIGKVTRKELPLEDFSENMGKGKECFFATYGQTREEVEAKLKTVEIQGRTYKVHELALDAFKKVGKAIKDNSYKIGSGGTYNWRLTADGKVSLHSFGIAIDINTDKNPFCPYWYYKNSTPVAPCYGKNQLITDIPAEIINAFKENGFIWGGDWKNSKDPMHFEWHGYCY